MGVIGSLIMAVVGLLVGGLGIYVGGQVIAGQGDYEHALWTAGLGSVAWVLTGGLIAFVGGWIPILGGLFELAGLFVGLFVYLGVVNLRYRGGWIDAGAIAAIAWAASMGVLLLLSTIVGGFDVIGVPFV